MLNQRKFSIAAALNGILSSASAQGVPDGRPITWVDLAGKTICWSHTRTVTYERDGRTIRDGHFVSIWSITEPGVARFDRPSGKILYVPLFVLPDGSFQTHRWFGKSGGLLTSVMSRK
jgi:hypothetical protein